jgi:hypothetical protein
MMTSRAILLVTVGVLVGACASQQKSTEDLLDTSLQYQEGLRWGRYEDSAAHVPPAAREDFLDDRDRLADDLRIDEYEVIRVKIAKGKDGAQIQVKYTWHLDSVGVVHETVVEQTWEQAGRTWLITEEVWKRGEKMPGVEVRVKKRRPNAPKPEEPTDTASNP